MKLQFYLNDKATMLGCKFEQPRDGDAGYDICAAEESYIWGWDWKKNKSNVRVLVSTGLHVQIPEGCVGILKDRSGLAMKGISVHAGVIDSSYTGEIKVVLQNNHYGGYRIHPGDRIAQMVIVPYLSIETDEVDSIDELGETERGDDGFGSTGI